MSTATKISTPVGKLQWVNISGQGKLNLSGKHIYTAELVLPPAEGAEFAQQYYDLWEAEKPKGAKEPKSLGFKIDPANSHYKFVFNTGTTLPSGDQKTIAVYDSKASKVDLGDKRIGNGSEGRIAGAIAVYDAGPAARGVTAYLDALQVTKLVEYTGGASFDEVEGGEFSSDAPF